MNKKTLRILIISFAAALIICGSFLGAQAIRGNKAANTNGNNVADAGQNSDNNNGTDKENNSDNTSSDTETSDDDNIISEEGVQDSSDNNEAPSSSPALDENNEPILPEATAEPDMDPDTWDYKIDGDSNMIYTDKEPAPKVMPYLLRVNKAMNTVTAYKPDKKGKYTKPVRAMVCSAGRKTPLGTFKTTNKYYWKAMIHNVWAQYATRITKDILFHSVPYDTHRKDTLITRYYNQLGGTASAGCVRLCVTDAKWIIENCPAGTTVEIYNDSNPGPLGKPKPIRIAATCRWDPTDPDDRNPYNMVKTGISGIMNQTLERGDSFHPLSGITAYDAGKKAFVTDKVKVDGSVDTMVPGTYKITYSFKASDGKKVKKKAVITVKDTKAPVIAGIPTKHYVKDATKITSDYVFNTVTLTDNSIELDKSTHMTISATGNVYTLVANDDFNHKTTYTITVIEDKEPPVIKLKDGLETSFPVSYKFTKAEALKRVESVTDDAAKYKPADLTVAIKPSGWGLTVKYSLKDHVGLTSSVTEKLAYEKPVVAVTEKNITLDNIDSEKTLKKYLSVTSEASGKNIKYSVKIRHKKINTTETGKVYTVTYAVTVKSSAGTMQKKVSLTATVPSHNIAAKTPVLEPTDNVAASSQEPVNPSPSVDISEGTNSATETNSPVSE